MKKISILFFTAAIALGLYNSSHANTSHFSQRPQVHEFIMAMVKNYGFNQNYLNQLFDKVQLQPKIIASITRPYEDKSWDDYQQLFVTQQRIDKGVAFWKQHQQALVKAQQQYGVPPDIIIAILGVETLYGERQGEYKVIDALSTLAFDYPPRAKFFKKELAQLLLLSREQHFDPAIIQGSYAGAIGFPQFMPSSYRRYAVNFNGSGNSDLRNNPNDVIYSVGNYFKIHGWIAKQPIIAPVKITGNNYQQLDVQAKLPKYTLGQLYKFGVTPINITDNSDTKAGLFRLDTKTRPLYWIGFDNFYVITQYNTSKQYAMAVLLLAEKIQQQYQHDGGKV